MVCFNIILKINSFLTTKNTLAKSGFAFKISEAMLVTDEKLHSTSKDLILTRKLDKIITIHTHTHINQLVPVTPSV